MAIRSFPTRGVLRRPPIRPVDLAVGAGIIGLLYTVVALAGSMTAAFPSHSVTQVTTRAIDLPYYAMRSLLRMFTALLLSIIFRSAGGCAGGS